ncbi:MAG TPA: ATP-binding cassette domain-containing protein [Solirubrobacteraceae bacterium]|jgi:putative ABC transport system ATP-binding protein
MTLLELDGVCKSYVRGERPRIVLSGVSLQIEPGELVAIWGARRSGRSTLLRVAAGVEAPDSGVVRFEGRDLSDREGGALGGGIGYCRRSFHPGEGRVVLDQIVAGLLACGVSRADAAALAQRALQRVGAGRCAALDPGELDGAETIRVAIARALALQPRLLVIDEPTNGVDLLERDSVLLLLRSLADEGIAVLKSTDVATGLSGADRALTLSEGELHGAVSPELGSVVPLRRPAARRASA